METMYRSLPFLFLLLAAGCRPAAPLGAAGRLSAPEKDTLRLMTVKVKETPETLHYQWSLLGERNWIRPTATHEGKAALAEVYPLNDARRSGGCPTWLCDAILTKQASGWQWELRLHGSNGKTATAKGLVADNNTPQILLTKDTMPRLPATVELVRMGATTLTLTVPK